MQPGYLFMQPSYPGFDPEAAMAEPDDYASTLFLFWCERRDAELRVAKAEGRKPDHGYATAAMIGAVCSFWSDTDRANFVDAHISLFRSVTSDPTIDAEIERRSLSPAEKESISCGLRQATREVDNAADFSRAIAVIAGLVGRYYGAEQRAACIVDFIIDSDIDYSIDTGEPPDAEATPSDSARAISSAPALVVTMRVVVQAGMLLIALILPSVIVERLTPAVGPTYEAAILVPAYAAVWLGLAAIYQGGRGQIVAAWRCVFLACAVVFGTVSYFQTGWHWIEARATSPESVAYQQDRLSRLDPAAWSGSDTAYVLKRAQIVRDLAIASAKENYEGVAASLGERHSTPFPATMTPWFVGLLLACLLVASCPRATIERILSPSKRHIAT